MPQPPNDPFDGLRLPVSAWKVLDAAHITSLKQLKIVAPQLAHIPGVDLESAHVISDRLERLAARRTVRVRLIFPKRFYHQAGRRRAHSSRHSPAGAHHK